ncbi:MAG TPA: hypothetical protein VGJ60_07060 [Chloroflexota bacterium]|jgi:hypothetical protein
MSYRPGDRFAAACDAFEARMAARFARQRRLMLWLMLPLYVGSAGLIVVMARS